MPKIRVALVGSEGRMGKVLQKLISESDDIWVVCKIDPNSSECKSVSEALKSRTPSIDVFVDFTQPDSVIDNIRKISQAGFDSVVGTTGWYDKIDEVKDIAIKNKTRILYAPNFAIGVNALFYITDQLSKLLGKLDFDVTVRELHHTKKADSPSGTAKALGKILKKNVYGKNKLTFERRVKRKDNEIDVLGGRVGIIAGHHEIWFTPKKSYSERLILQHDAFNPEVFGIGALQGMRWIVKNKDKKPGLYTFKENVLGLK